jgi:hypothetical protein
LLDAPQHRIIARVAELEGELAPERGRHEATATALRRAPGRIAQLEAKAA